MNKEKDSEELVVDEAMLNDWATNPKGPVALVLKEKLMPVEGERGIIFPPTYADIGYNIDELSDGKKIATIDSVGSQANRMEPLFKEESLKDLVPQIDIKINEEKIISIFDIGHRLGDALIRCSDFSAEAKEAFENWREGDAFKLAKLAPTSIVFGAWDSRDTAAKLPRIVQSVIRAWDVTELKRSATYVPPVDYSKLDIFSEEDKAKAEGDTKNPLAKRGFVHVPAGKVPGGVIANGPIYRDVTVNLVALRQIKSKEKRDELRKYILGLSLTVAIQPLDGFLRQGCLLTLDPTVKESWIVVNRDGTRQSVTIKEQTVLDYAKKSSNNFGVGKSKKAEFDKKKAKEDSQKDKKKKKGKDKENEEKKDQ